MRYRLVLLVVLLSALVQSQVAAQAPAPDPELAKGKGEVARGEYKEAVTTLSTVVRRLRYASGQDALAAEAYLQLGIAYAALGQTSPARSQFVQALVRNPQIAPDPKTTPPKALELFEASRGETQGLVAKKGMSKGAKIAIGAGGAAAVIGGVAAASSSSGTSGGNPPPPAFTPAPGGVSPFVQLLSASPSPSNIVIPLGSVVTFTIRVENSGQGGPYPELILVVHGVAPDGRACLVAERGPFNFNPVIRLDMVLRAETVCPGPFQTQTIVLALEVPGTRQRAYTSNYAMVYRFGQ
jgi:hypothetical protein